MIYKGFGIFNNYAKIKKINKIIFYKLLYKV